MKIELKKTWFNHRGERYRKGVHTVPDDWADRVPKGTKIIEELTVPEKKAEAPDEVPDDPKEEKKSSLGLKK